MNRRSLAFLHFFYFPIFTSQQYSFLSSNYTARNLLIRNSFVYYYCSTKASFFSLSCSHCLKSLIWVLSLNSNSCCWAYYPLVNTCTEWSVHRRHLLHPRGLQQLRDALYFSPRKVFWYQEKETLFCFGVGAQVAARNSMFCTLLLLLNTLYDHCKKIVHTNLEQFLFQVRRQNKYNARFWLQRE